CWYLNTNINQSVTIDVLDNDFVVNGSPSISISRTANNGTAVVQMDNSISYTPGMDYCGSDDFEYSLCDSLGFCDTATVGITIACPIPLSTIATVRADANGDLVPDSINRTVELRGIVYGENLRTNGLQFTLIDPTGGIAVFIFDFAGYTVQEGDSLRVVGRITQFGGLDQIAPTSIEVISNDNDLEDPVVVTALDESTESAFIRINNLQLVDPSQWDNSLPDNGAGMNIQVTDGTNTYTMRIDNDVDLYNQMAPTEGFDLVGIGGQFDLGTPPDSAYQILPRYEEDLKLRTSTIEQWDLPIKLFPNPATAELFIQAGEEASQIDIYNLLGQPMRSIQEPGLNPRISLEGLAEGMYWLSYQKGRQVKVLKFSIIR
ncbi:MAG: T9SS type A sorting domain-containing protein, partial [Bacteroidota bacterium]